MRFAFPRHAVLIHLAVAVAFLASGYCHHFSLVSYLPLIWLSLALFEVMLLFPPARRGERTTQSRRRAFSKLVHDPLFYLGGVGLLYITVQALNGPCRLGYSLTENKWLLQPPPLPLLPGSLAGGEAFEGFFWLLPAWVAILAVRIGLTRRAKQRLLMVLVAISALVAAVALLHYASGAGLALWGNSASSLSYGTFADRNAAGLFHAICFFTSGGLLFDSLANDGKIRTSRLLFAALLLNLLAASFSLSNGVLIFVWGIGALWLLYNLYYLYHSCSRAAWLRYIVVIFMTAVALVFLHLVAYPDNMLHRKIDEIRAGPGASSKWWQQQSVLRQAAWRSFKVQPLYGSGTWGFQHTVGSHLSDEEWGLLSEEQQTPHSCYNDPLQLLAELGVVGALMLLAALVILWFDPLRRLVVALKRGGGAVTETNTTRRRISPVAVSLLVALTGAAVLSLFGMPFRTPLVVVVWVVLLAVLPALIPVPKGAREAEGRKRTSKESRHRKRRFAFLSKNRA